MAETTKLRKIGNSSGINLPKKVVDALHFNLGEELHLTIKGDCLIVRKIPSLKDLLATVPDGHREGEWDTGKAVGKEVIDDE